MKSVKEFLKEHRYRLLELGIIVVLGLTPLLWFKGYLITGGDVNFPLDPSGRLIQRFYVWGELIGGTDRSMDLAAQFFTGLQAFFYNLGFGLITTEKLTFIFWFTLMGFSMYFLMSQLIKDKDPKAIITRIASVVFYMFNFYQIYIWELVKIGEIAGAVIIPALLGVFISGLEGRISYAKAAVLICIFSIICSGFGFQPPVLGAFLLTLLMYFAFHLFMLARRKDKANILHSVRFSVLFALIFFLISMFWILPVGNFAIQSGYTSTSTGIKVYSAIPLLEYCSKFTSFSNVFRQFGEIFWFDSWGGQRYTPYFQAYQTNVILILLSFMLPILAFSALFISRNRYVLFFAILSVVGIFLGKGIHPPFGSVYLWAFENIPGFWIYRAPWQKFGILIALGYSFLAGLSCSQIYKYLHNHVNSKNTKPVLPKIKRSFPTLAIAFILLLNIGYTYPLVLGKMFPSSEGDVGYHEHFDLTYHNEFPQYIFDAADRINSIEEEFKIVTLPDAKTNVYEWGFGAVGDITDQLFNKGVIFRQYGEGFAPPHPVGNMHQIFVSSLYNDLTPNAGKILGLLNVRYVLQRNDFRYDFYGDNDSPKFIESRLSSQNGIHLERTFGRWDLYRNDHFVPRIYAVADLIYIDGDIESLIPLVSDNDFNPQSAVFFSKILPEQNNFAQNIAKYRIYTDKAEIIIPVSDGRDNPINWTTMMDKYEARSYAGSKGIIRVDGTGDPDMFVFSSLEDAPYTFPSRWTPPEWYSIDSTHVYIKTGSEPLEINGIYIDGKPVSDVIGIYWETGWMGMTTKSVMYPVQIPANQRVIIHINHLVKEKETVTLHVTPAGTKLLSTSLDNPKEHLSIRDIFDSDQDDKAEIIFQKINPTEYKIKVENATQPFFLILSESYHPQWKAYIGNVNGLQALFEKPISDDEHLLINGYANAWYIDPEELRTGEEFDITLNYWPQSLFYIGLIISGLTFAGCISWLVWGWRRGNRPERRD